MFSKQLIAAFLAILASNQVYPATCQDACGTDSVDPTCSVQGHALLQTKGTVHDQNTMLEEREVSEHLSNQTEHSTGECVRRSDCNGKNPNCKTGAWCCGVPVAYGAGQTTKCLCSMCRWTKLRKLCPLLSSTCKVRMRIRALKRSNITQCLQLLRVDFDKKNTSDWCGHSSYNQVNQIVIHNRTSDMVLIGVWWGYFWGPTGKCSARDVRVCKGGKLGGNVQMACVIFFSPPPAGSSPCYRMSGPFAKTVSNILSLRV